MARVSGAPRVGFVGIGRMGLPMCARLVRAGYEVVAAPRYGPVDGELLGVALLEEQAGLALRAE